MTEQIAVTPTQLQNGQIAWSLCYKGQCGGPGHPTNKAYPPIMVPADGVSHDFKISITKPDFGITFNPDALWMAHGKGVHPPKGLHSHHQINSYTVDTGGKDLTFTDDNSNLFGMWLSYRLNFVQGQKAVSPIDPDWHNGGGGFSLYYSSAQVAAVTIVAALVLLAIGFGIGRFTAARKVGPREIGG